MTKGDIADPFILSVALMAGIQPGHTLYLRGGTYTGSFVSVLQGTEAKPITIKPYPGEKPIIDGSLTINGADTIWEGLEVWNSAWATRHSSQNGSAPTDIPSGGAGGSGIDIFGVRTTVRNCTIHDTRQGIGLWSASQASTVEECLIYNNGWIGADRGHGHPIYTQNATGTKTIKRNVLISSYSDYSIHAYTEGGSIQGFDVVENVTIDKNMIFGGFQPVDRLALTRNICYGGGIVTGYQSNAQNVAATLTDNELLNSAAWSKLGTWPQGQPAASGTNTTLGNRQIQLGRFLVVCNQAGAASVSAPQAGTYTNALNPAESVVLAQGAALTMQGWTVATPTGASAPILTTTFPSMGVFLLS